MSTHATTNYPDDVPDLSSLLLPLSVQASGRDAWTPGPAPDGSMSGFAPDRPTLAAVAGGRTPAADSGYDELTGLPTKLLLADRTQQAMLKARRSGEHLALFLLELDNFDFVAQTFSPRHADRLVLEVARRLRRALRRDDTVARCGPALFAVLTGELAGESSTALILRKVQEAIREPYVTGSLTVELDLTVGVTVNDGGGGSAAALMERASQALRRAKAGVGGGFAFYEPKLAAVARARLELDAELRNALEADEFVLHYQPRVSLASGAVNSVEALVRWQHPVRGLLQPAEFVPLLEEARLGSKLFDWVLERSCAQAKAWQTARTAKRVAVNVSPSALEAGDLYDRVKASLVGFDLHPGLLELEISERTSDAALEGAHGQLEALRSLGVQVVLDDFGMSNFSLARLHSLPLDGLKIDRSFVSCLGTGRDACSLDVLGAMVALGKSLKLRVTAEGIETKEQSRLVRTLPCDDGQGFLFSHPVRADLVPAFA